MFEGCAAKKNSFLFSILNVLQSWKQAKQPEEGPL